MLGVKSLFVIKKVRLISKNLLSHSVVLTTDTIIAAVDQCLTQSDWHVMRYMFK